jgi:hypothetical protein
MAVYALHHHQRLDPWSDRQIKITAKSRRGLAFKKRGARKPSARKTRRSSLMGLEEDIIKLLKNEGFKMNEAIRDALDEFVDIVDEENEDMEENLDDDDEKEDKDEE